MKFAHKLDDILTVFYIVLFLVAILLVTIWRAWSRRKLFKSTGDIACLRKNISTKLIYNTLCLVLVIRVLIWDANVGFGIAGVLLCVMEVLVVRARMLIQSQGE